MKCNAITIANEFIATAKEECVPITHLRLMKLVYIAYGFGLSVLGSGKMIDDRFDTVEAWKFGPVIPSVYHTFKHFKDKPITEFGEIATSVTDEEKADYKTPRLSNERDDCTRKTIINFVWRRYKNMSASDLVHLLHLNGAPWALSYRVGENAIIPEKITKRYYDLLLDDIYDNARRKD
jgi:uncharacterized phage-associated protein